jgi:hypothetical protein
VGVGVGDTVIGGGVIEGVTLGNGVSGGKLGTAAMAIAKAHSSVKRLLLIVLLAVSMITM